MKKQPRCTENGVEVNMKEEIDKLRAEHEAMVLNLQLDHDAEVRNIHIFYESRIGELQINHGMTVDNLQRDHESLVFHLRSLNFEQGIRQEAALRSMRDLKDKMRRDHDEEVQRMRLQYDNLVRKYTIEINSLVEENKLLCSEHESVLRALHGTTQVFKENMKSSTNSNILAESGAMIKRLQSMYKNSSLELSSTYPEQNGTEVEGLQLTEEATIIAAQLQTIDGVGHEDSDADTTTSSIGDDGVDTTTSTIADDDAVDMVKSQDTMVQKTVEDCQKLFYDTAQKLSLFQGYVFSKESNFSPQTDYLQQQLDDFEEDAHSPQNSHDNSKYKDQDSEDENYAVAVAVKLLSNSK
ncbi:unnamed protein product [Macrosiphum euphorbiae]|nr:unnamed protein product [Macrosiphum euphorbiae]